MSIDNVLYHVGPGFEVYDDAMLGEDVIVAKMTEVEFMIGYATFTVEVEAHFYNSEESVVFFLLHQDGIELFENNDSFTGWVDGDTIRKYAKVQINKFKKLINSIELPI